MSKSKQDVRARFRKHVKELNYEAYTGYGDHGERSDTKAVSQFRIMIRYGLREHHHLLSIGCGGLVADRFLIMYLNAARYHGIEPNEWLVQEGIRHEIGQDLIDIKKPRFDDNDQFNLDVFCVKYDYMIAHSIFTHAALNQIKACLASAKQVLKPQGIFLATYFPGPRDYTKPHWSYPPVVRFRPETMRKAIIGAGLQYRQFDWLGPHRGPAKWLAIGLPSAIPRIEQGLRGKL